MMLYPERCTSQFCGKAPGYGCDETCPHHARLQEYHQWDDRRKLKKEMLRAAQGWERQADEAEAKAKYERESGIDMSEPGQSPGDHKARLYRDTALSLRMEIETGKAHCVCHLVPTDRCPARVKS